MRPITVNKCACISQGSPVKQTKMMYLRGDLWKELDHIIIEAEKFQELQMQLGEPGKPVV